MPVSDTTVGVVGLGEIGRGLASSIQKAGIPLAVYDVRPEAARQFDAGAQVCDDLEAIGRAARVLVVAVLTDSQVLEVLDPQKGALAAMGEGSTVVLVSTVSIDTVRRVAEWAAGRGVGVVDCGVSGGAAAAAEGHLVSMVGGSDEDVEKVRPAIEAFSELVVRMGPIGSGQRAKLARNLIQYASWLAAFEGQRLAEAAGIDLSKLAEVVRVSDRRIGGVSTLMFRSTTAPFADTDDAGLVAAMTSAAALAHKDLGAAISLGRELGVELPAAQLADSYADAVFGVGPAPGPKGERP